MISDADDPFNIRFARFDHRGGTYRALTVEAQPVRTERIATGYGEPFDKTHYARTVEIYVSPTGRSVRVFVDGQEVPARGSARV